GIIGMPLGIFWSRGGRAYGFMASIVVVFCYYLLLNVGESLAKSATVPAVVGIWLPNVLLGALGGYLFYKAAREEEIPLLQKLGAVSAAVLARISYLYRNPKGKHAK
ncbi:MAG: LptF/LptG family permease, partial [Deltaproteobacteria bacterium]|nr:LptF/LptG family permease [Deltaproteobacteria bacterium]